MEESPFFVELVKGCRRSDGKIHINVIAKCNQLAMKPIELLSQLHHWAHKYWLRIETTTPVYVWRFEGKRANEGTLDQQRLKLIDAAFARLESEEGMERVIEAMNEVQGTALRKLNALYSLSYLHSNNSVTNIIQKHLLLPPDIPLRGDTVSAQFDDYFRQ